MDSDTLPASGQLTHWCIPGTWNATLPNVMAHITLVTHFVHPGTTGELLRDVTAFTFAVQTQSHTTPPTLVRKLPYKVPLSAPRTPATGAATASTWVCADFDEYQAIQDAAHYDAVFAPRGGTAPATAIHVKPPSLHASAAKALEDHMLGHVVAGTPDSIPVEADALSVIMDRIQASDSPALLALALSCHPQWHLQNLFDVGRIELSEAAERSKVFKVDRAEMFVDSDTMLLRLDPVCLDALVKLTEPVVRRIQLDMGSISAAQTPPLDAPGAAPAPVDGVDDHGAARQYDTADTELTNDEVIAVFDGEEGDASSKLRAVLEAESKAQAATRVPHMLYLSKSMHLRSNPTHKPVNWRQFGWVAIGRSVISVPLIHRLGFPINKLWKTANSGVRIPMKLSDLLIELSGIALTRATLQVAGATSGHCATSMNTIVDPAAEEGQFVRMTAYADIFMQHLLALLHTDARAAPFLKYDNDQAAHIVVADEAAVPDMQAQEVAVAYGQETYNQKAAGGVTAGNDSSHHVKCHPTFRLKHMDRKAVDEVIKLVFQKYDAIPAQDIMLRNVRALAGPNANVTRIFSIGLTQTLRFDPHLPALGLTTEQKEACSKDESKCMLFVHQRPFSTTNPLVSSCTRYNNMGNAGVFDSVTIMTCPNASPDLKDAHPYFFGTDGSTKLSMYRLQQYQPRLRSMQELFATLVPQHGSKVEELCGRGDATEVLDRLEKLRKDVFEVMPAYFSNPVTSSSPCRSEAAIVLTDCGTQKLTWERVAAATKIFIESIGKQPNAVAVPAHSLYTNLMIRLQISVLCMKALLPVLLSIPQHKWGDNERLVYGALRNTHRSLRVMLDGYAPFAKLFSNPRFTALCKNQNRMGMLLPVGVWNTCMPHLSKAHLTGMVAALLPQATKAPKVELSVFGKLMHNVSRDSILAKLPDGSAPVPDTFPTCRTLKVDKVNTDEIITAVHFAVWCSSKEYVAKPGKKFPALHDYQCDTKQHHLLEVVHNMSKEDRTTLTDYGREWGIDQAESYPCNFFNTGTCPKIETAAPETPTICVTMPNNASPPSSILFGKCLYQPVAVTCDCVRWATINITQAGSHQQQHIALDSITKEAISTFMHNVPSRSGVPSRKVFDMSSHTSCDSPKTIWCVRIGTFPVLTVPATEPSATIAKLCAHVDGRVTRWQHSYSGRASQLAILDALHEYKGDAILRLPTGFGKTFLIAASSFIRKGITLVIAPSLPLIKDAVNQFNRHVAAGEGPIAANLEAMDSKTAENLVHSCFAADSKSPLILYATPDFLVFHLLRYFLLGTVSVAVYFMQRIAVSGLLKRVVFDEVHMLRSAGCAPKFRGIIRACYLVRALYPNVPITCLSATMPIDVLLDVIHLLGLCNPLLIGSDIGRKDIALYHVDVNGSLPGVAGSDASSPSVTDVAGEELMRQIEAVPGNVLRFCSTVKLCKNVAEYLTGTMPGVRVHCCTAATFRTGFAGVAQALTSYSTGQITARNVVCCTTVLSVGVNLPVVGHVIELTPPYSCTDKVQSSGRAGREHADSDKPPVRSTLFLWDNEVAWVRWQHHLPTDWQERSTHNSTLSESVVDAFSVCGLLAAVRSPGTGEHQKNFLMSHFAWPVHYEFESAVPGTHIQTTNPACLPPKSVTAFPVNFPNTTLRLSPSAGAMDTEVGNVAVPEQEDADGMEISDELDLDSEYQDALEKEPEFDSVFQAKFSFLAPMMAEMDAAPMVTEMVIAPTSNDIEATINAVGEVDNNSDVFVDAHINAHSDDNVQNVGSVRSRSAELAMETEQESLRKRARLQERGSSHGFSSLLEADDDDD
jgi:superfamily II DNA helicase RecQ